MLTPYIPWEISQLIRRYGSRFRRFYRKHNLKIFVTLLLVTTLAAILLFLFNITYGWFVAVLGFTVLAIDMVGLELFCSDHPSEVLEDAQKDKRIYAAIESGRLEILKRIQDSTNIIPFEEVKRIIIDIIDDYRLAFRYNFIFRIFRYFFNVSILIILFACTARYLVLTAGAVSQYTGGLSVTSLFLDYIYFATVTMGTGYSNIVPISPHARILCITEYFATMFMLAFAINYIVLHEQTREIRFIEILERRMMTLAGWM